MATGKIKIWTFGLCLAALLAIPAGAMRAQAAVEPEEDETAGIMGRSVVDEMEENEDTGLLESLSTIASRYSFMLVGTEATQDEYIANAWSTTSSYTKSTYYHRSDYASRYLFNGIDVSWHQGGGKNSTTTSIDWSKAHSAGIDYVFVRASSRDSSDGSLYADTCADAHIQGALSNNMNVGLYVFSQALTTTEAKEEANALLSQIKKYGWDITMPLVMDRENGSYKRLVAGQLSKSQETAIIEAFAQTVLDAGYTPMVYANASWLVDYVDTSALDAMGCKIWMARYNTYADKTVNSDATYAKLSAIDYEFWQYSSSGTVSGYSGNLDMDFWYKDLTVAVTDLSASTIESTCISMKWGAADGASSYRVYRKTGDASTYSLIDEVSGTCYYKDTGLTAGTDYSYQIKPVYVIGGTTYVGSKPATLAVTTTSQKTSGLKVKDQTDSSITLKWDETSGASGYRIYEYDEGTGAYAALTDVSGETTSKYKVTGLSSATEYSFKVRAYKTSGSVISFDISSAACGAKTLPAQVTGLTANKVKKRKVTLSWDKVDGANGYRIFRLNPETGKYEKIATVKGKNTLTYTDEGLKPGKEYTYKVCAYTKYDGAKYRGTRSKKLVVTTKPKTT